MSERIAGKLEVGAKTLGPVQVHIQHNMSAVEARLHEAAKTEAILPHQLRYKTMLDERVFVYMYDRDGFVDSGKTPKTFAFSLKAGDGLMFYQTGNDCLVWAPTIRSALGLPEM